MTKTEKKQEREPELRPDGWERFRSAVHAAAKSGPKHRAKGSPLQEKVPKKPTKPPR